MKKVLLMIMATAIYAAENKYEFSYTERPTDKAQVRVEIENAFRDAGVVVKSIAIREGNGKRIDIRYVVVVEGEIALKTMEETFNKDRTPKAKIEQVVDGK